MSTIVDRRYAALEQRRFFPTHLGEQVERVMVKSFPDVFNVTFTSHMETDLDKIEEGEVNWRKMLGDFYGPFAISVKGADIEALIGEAHDLSALATEKCPTCSGKLVPRGGFFGPFLACENHPKECKYTRPLRGDRKPAQLTSEICHECGELMVIRQGRRVSSFGCSSFPKCRGPDRCRRASSVRRMAETSPSPLEKARQASTLFQYPKWISWCWDNPSPRGVRVRVLEGV